jgi:hypothetical protein
MTKRRVNGEGSVYRRGDGRVVGEYEDANGKHRYFSGKTKAEVRQKLRKVLADRDAGIAYDSENLTVGAYLHRWLDAVKGSVRERTWERHEQVVRVHLEPTIGGVKLDRLIALQVQSVYRQKLDAGHSPRSVEIIHATLHNALKQAVRWSLIPRNVAASTTPPRPTRREITPLSQGQARALLEAIRGDALYAFYVLAVTTGMRNGELLGLGHQRYKRAVGGLHVEGMPKYDERRTAEMRRHYDSERDRALDDIERRASEIYRDLRGHAEDDGDLVPESVLETSERRPPNAVPPSDFRSSRPTWADRPTPSLPAGSNTC